MNQQFHFISFASAALQGCFLARFSWWNNACFSSLSAVLRSRLLSSIGLCFACVSIPTIALVVRRCMAILILRHRL
jgi:hypothetical protein